MPTLTIQHQTPIQLQHNLPTPLITLTHNDTKDRHITEIVTIDLENEKGETARYWITTRTQHGRPILEIATAVNKGQKITTKEITGTYNRL